ncbi:Ribonuclease BN, tRNA processing enzyme [Streptomyces zhaozhouensis]|uniref:Ribonuclease BN, tRNA processing enzyme n=1 Tax=Streptomyces zhaozhouensis TaxID=1300267 RepID=A0A286DU79_9ACTN|nr:MBL fold metallo-hydrolase [Streptomyces zhaozhouensis]SOD62226.1 Ribonuclease BN, tRNA processing enzyme [Streptomyces zhaozhouensis]
MRALTVLGSCGAWPEAGRAASGFLLEVDGFRLALDLGYATLPRLLARCPADALDAVVITHEHPDHCADLSALCRALHFGGRRAGRTPLYCPPGVLTRVGALEPTEPLDDVLAPHPLPGRHEVGPFRLEGRPLPHHVPHAGVRLTAPGLTLAYTGDAGPAPALGELASGADLLVAGATLQGGRTDPHLLSAAEAGRWAADSGVGRLLLTHFWPGAERGRSVAEAAAAYGGEVLAAREGMVLSL